MAIIKRYCVVSLLISSISLSLGGCTSIEKVLPQDGPTMLDIYEGHVAATGEPTRRAPTSATGMTPPENRPGSDWQEIRTGAELVSYTRTVESEIETLFPELPNPRIIMYVFPHLTTKDRLPVPGYATAFSMYERTEFALPGEVAPKRSVIPTLTATPQQGGSSLHRASFTKEKEQR